MYINYTYIIHCQVDISFIFYQKLYYISSCMIACIPERVKSILQGS